MQYFATERAIRKCFASASTTSAKVRADIPIGAHEKVAASHGGACIPHIYDEFIYIYKGPLPLPNMDSAY
jgi:hypothetical protein